MKKYANNIEQYYPKIVKVKTPFFGRFASQRSLCSISRGLRKRYVKRENVEKQFEMKVKIKTKRGNMVVALYTEDAPSTVENFVRLVKDGYYDGLTFHRIIPDFVIQGGCPQGDGTGGPGYSIDCELDGGNQRHEKGVLSMAHAGRNTGGSQFFICHNRENTRHLDGNHTCFGKVTEGLEVIDYIKRDDVMDSVAVMED